MSFSNFVFQVFYLKLWNLQRNTTVQEPPSFPLEIGTTSISQCGHYLAYLDHVDADIKVHDIRSNNFDRKTSIPLMNTDDTDRSITALHLKFSNNSRFIFCGTAEGALSKLANRLRQPEVPANDLAKQYQSQTTLTTFSISNDDQHVLMSSRDSHNEHQSLTLLSSTTLQKEADVTLSDFDVKGNVTALRLSNSIMGNAHAFVGTDACLIYVIRLTCNDEDGNQWNNSLLCELSSHGSPLSFLALNYSQNVLFSGSTGQTRRLWKLKVGGFSSEYFWR